MPQIIPIKDLKNTSEVSELCHKSDEPIFVTKNGYGDMVIMSMEAYASGNELIGEYWSSYESSTVVWFVNLASPYYGTNPKTDTYKVRAVLAF